MKQISKQCYEIGPYIKAETICNGVKLVTTTDDIFLTKEEWLNLIALWRIKFEK